MEFLERNSVARLIEDHRLAPGPTEAKRLTLTVNEAPGLRSISSPTPRDCARSSITSWTTRSNSLTPEAYASL